MKTLPPPTRSLVIVRQLSMPLDTQKLNGLNVGRKPVGDFIGGNRFQSAAGEWMPLYVGRIIHQFNHRAASVVVNEANLHTPALSGDVTSEMKADPSFLPASQYWLLSAEAVRGSAKGFRDIARSTDVGTMIAATIPHRAAGNTAPLILSDAPLADQAQLLGNLNALVLDYVARQKAQSTHLNWYIVEQLPIIPPAAYARTFGPKTAADIVREAALELSYTANALAPFARDMGHVDAAGEVLPPFVWDADRRLRLRAKLDALSRFRSRRPDEKPRRHPLHLFDLPHRRTGRNRKMGHLPQPRPISRVDQCADGREAGRHSRRIEAVTNWRMED